MQEVIEELRAEKLKKKAVKAVATKKAAAPEPAPEAEAVGAMTTKTVKPPLDEPAALAAAPEDDLTALRQQYKDKFGKSPFMGWSVATLQDKLAEKPAS